MGLSRIARSHIGTHVRLYPAQNIGSCSLAPSLLVGQPPARGSEAVCVDRGQDPASGAGPTALG